MIRITKNTGKSQEPLRGVNTRTDTLYEAATDELKIVAVRLLDHMLHFNTETGAVYLISLESNFRYLPLPRGYSITIESL